MGQDIISQEEYKDIVEYNRQQMEQIENDIFGLRESLKHQSQNTDMLQKLSKQIEKILEFNDLTKKCFTV